MFGYNKVSQEEYTQVKSALAEANLFNTRLEANLEEAKAAIEALTSDKSKQAKLIKQHQTEVENLKAQHAVEMEGLKTSVNRKINQSLASIGVNQFASEIYSEKREASDQELLIQLNSLPQELKTEFYQAHKAQLSRAVLAKT